jgi:eukaryotic-like serine/threonine-protein kinase
MIETRWTTLQTLFAAALERPPDERSAFLRAACGDDAALYREVESLLGVEVHPLLDGLAVDAVGLPAVPSVVGDRIGPWRITGELGRGGMGTVYRAERDDGAYHQSAALKLVRRGMDTETVLRRFLAERQLLARLQHPNIARLLDGGVTEDGRPYFVLELVEGEPITDYCDRRRLDLGARIALFRRVCEVVQYAHRQLVVHRDLKPSNILVSEDGRVKLLDFGIAKLLTEDEGSGPPLTAPGHFPLTPEYAAPEQVRGDAVSTVTDVYALGVILYDLLAGRRPYAFDRRSATEIERVVTTLALARPSAFLSETPPSERAAVAAARRVSWERLRRQLVGDLDTICLTALRKEPERRFGSAEALAEDLRRYTEGLPILARADTFGYRARKFVRRHRTGLAGAAGALAVILVVASAAFVRVQVERDRARLEAETSAEVSRFLTDLFGLTVPGEGRGADLTGRAILDHGAARVEGDLADRPVIRARLLTEIADAYAGAGLPVQADSVARRALALLDGLYPRAHPDLARGRTVYGNTRLNLGAYDSADSLYALAAETTRELAGPRSLDYAQALHHRGWVRYSTGQHAAAESLFAAAAAIFDNYRDPDYERYMEPRLDLANAQIMIGRYTDAVASAEQAYATRRGYFGADHRATLSSLNTLGWAYSMRGDLAVADSVYRSLLRLQRGSVGERHPNVAWSLMNLGNVRSQAGDYAEALDFKREALSISAEEYAGDSRLKGLLLINIGYSQALSGAAPEAVQTLQDGLAMLKRLYGDDNFNVARAHSLLGHAYHRAGRLEEAEASYMRGVQMLRAHTSATNPLLASPLLDLGSLYMDRNEPGQALTLLEEAYSIRERAFGSGHWRTAEVATPLAQALRQLGHSTEAEGLLARADGPGARGSP